MTVEERIAARERCEKATPGWRIGSQAGNSYITSDDRWVSPPFNPEKPDNIVFAANARQDLPSALDALDAADTEIAALQAELRVTNLRAQSAEKIMAARAKLLSALDQRYRWRPIAELHEDYGPVVLMDIHDPGSLQIGSNLETDFDESDWTHFSQIAPLSHEEAERLKENMPAAKGDT